MKMDLSPLENDSYETQELFDLFFLNKLCLFEGLSLTEISKKVESIIK